jgi:hypothetical protein
MIALDFPENGLQFKKRFIQIGHKGVKLSSPKVPSKTSKKIKKTL